MAIGYNIMLMNGERLIEYNLNLSTNVEPIVIPETGLVSAYLISKEKAARHRQIAHVLKEGIIQRAALIVGLFDEFLVQEFTNDPAIRYLHPKSSNSSSNTKLESEYHERILTATDDRKRHIRYIITYDRDRVKSRHVTIKDPDSQYRNSIDINFINGHLGMQNDSSHISLIHGEPHLDPLTKEKDPRTYADILDLFKEELDLLNTIKKEQ